VLQVIGGRLRRLVDIIEELSFTTVRHLWLTFSYVPNGHGRDPVSAYMWLLLSQRAAASMHQQIESSKSGLSQVMSPQQLAEAERRADEWLSSTKKKSGFAEAADPPSKSKMVVGGP
jgi:hypothetical protein